MRVDRREVGAPRRDREQVVHRLAGERVSAFGKEEPRRGVRARRQVSPDRTQLVSGDRLLDRQAVLQAPDPKAGAVEIDFVAAQVDRLAHPQAVAIHHQNEQVIACAVPPGFRRFKQRGDLGLGQVVLRPLVGIRDSGGDTLDISPPGRPHWHRRKPLIDQPPTIATLDKMRLL